MKTIWKFPAPLTEGGALTVSMPVEAQILALKMQGEVPCIWALCDDAFPKVDRHFTWRGTGTFADGLSLKDHVGTVQIEQVGVNYVFHLFEAR